ncbi:S8 family peptidase [Virgibacillus xinjiangensis]|uniref:S8 family peptidase n=1 Tax=Virgibacillus xinjiangensis TaxID=393090 RepID=A0ABV7CWG6_9BACI
MLNFSMIQLLRKNGNKVDKTVRQELIGFYRPFRSIPCFLHRPIEIFRKKVKKMPILIEFESNSFTAGMSEIQGKCSQLRELPLISSCSAKTSVENIEYLLTNCSHIKKIHYDRKMTALLDTAVPSIHADQLQQAGWTGKDVTIAVVDTGIHPHPDLEDRILGFSDLVNGRSETYDDNGHGTHCAGDAASNGAQSAGQYQGPAPEANLVGVKVLDKMGAGSLSTVIEGIQWCIDNQSAYNIRVLSLSLGSEAVESAEDDPAVQAVNRAWQSGIAVFAAAGNSGPDPQSIASPGISPMIITVGAVDDNDTAQRSDVTVPDFSSRGPTIDEEVKPDLLAPGVNIVSLRSPGSFIDKTNKGARVGSDYISLSGTSMATPICAGVAAQLLEQDRERSPDDIKTLLLEASEDIGQPPNVQGNGYLNASELLPEEQTD